MIDLETHPAGTADLLKLLRSNTPNMAVGHADMRHAADHIEQLEAALTRANAATAAAYEVAAREVECGCGAGPCQDTANCAAEDAAAIRALATPDQTAALDKLIAEAKARVWAEANAAIGKTYDDGLVSWPQYQRVKSAILAASKKGGA